MRFFPDIEGVRLHRRNLVSVAGASVVVWTMLLTAAAALT
jgi:hypothetical protein